MPATLIPVRSAADILPEWSGTPVADLLLAVNAGRPPPTGRTPALLVSHCWEDQAPLPLPAGFALVVTAPGGVLKRSPFDVSWAVADAGVGALAVVGHEHCGLGGLRARREEFVVALTERAGWERPAAEQHFDHWSDLVEVVDPAASALAEAQRLQRRYPRLTVAPLLRLASGALAQITP
jgi:carbonic anhydrase